MCVCVGARAYAWSEKEGALRRLNVVGDEPSAVCILLVWNFLETQFGPNDLPLKNESTKEKWGSM